MLRVACELVMGIYNSLMRGKDQDITAKPSFYANAQERLQDYRTLPRVLGRSE